MFNIIYWQIIWAIKCIWDSWISAWIQKCSKISEGQVVHTQNVLARVLGRGGFRWESYGQVGSQMEK